MIDLWGRRRWAFPLVVIGMNSIAAYCMAHSVRRLSSAAASGPISAPTPSPFSAQPTNRLVHGALVLFVMWLLLFWMYRRKLFLRI